MHNSGSSTGAANGDPREIAAYVSNLRTSYVRLLQTGVGTVGELMGSWAWSVLTFSGHLQYHSEQLQYGSFQNFRGPQIDLE